MGFLNSNEIIVDAVLTKKGRQLLAEGDPNFKITKFAVSDDGVDYRLYDFDHPSGSNYYGSVIENTPMMEAVVDESMTMRYKLVTLAKGTTRLPIISVSPTSISLSQRQVATISPNTLNGSVGYNNKTYGYTFILSDNRLGRLEVAQASAETSAAATNWLDDETLKRSISAVGLKMNFIAANVSSLSDSEKSGIITVIGNETGGIVEIPVTIEYIAETTDSEPVQAS